MDGERGVVCGAGCAGRVFSPVAAHDKMVSLVETMLDLHKRLAEAKTPTDRQLLERQIATTDNQIDRLVYELYELTEEEIGIVEEATS